MIASPLSTSPQSARPGCIAMVPVANARSDQIDVAGGEGQRLGVAPSQSPEASDADTQADGGHQKRTGWPLSALSLAASARICAFTPSATVVRNGAPLCRHSKKCAISSR